MEYDYYKEMKAKKKKNWLYYILGLGILFLAISSGTVIYLEVLELREIGDFQSVYWTNFFYKILFSAAGFFITFISIFFTNLLIKRNFKRYFLGFEGKLNKVTNVPIAFIIAFISSISTKEIFYEKGLMFLNRTDFGVKDPIFGFDIGYFMFSRPFLISVVDFFSSLAVFVIFYTIVYYFLLGVVSFDKFIGKNFAWDNATLRPFFRHNFFNISIFFLIKAFSYKFQREGILYASVIDVVGAGFVDVKVWLPYYRIIPFILIAIVGISLFFIQKGRIKKTVLTIAVFPAISILVSIIATGVQFFFVNPNVINYEGSFIKNNMEMTRKAFGIDRMRVVDFPQVRELTKEMIARNRETVDNIRIIDYESTLENNLQTQRIRNFYTFHDGNIVNFPQGEESIPVFITAREILSSQNLPSQTYNSIRFRYTHGYGVVINPINKITNQGQVQFLIGDLKDNQDNIEEPRIYYGQLTDQYVFVNAEGLDEFNYDGEASVRYQGQGGILLTPWNRLLYALKYADYQMLVSSYINRDTRLLLNREVVKRAQKALPFIQVDKDPYIMVSDDGRLKWVLDGYTLSDKYPYAQTIRTFNYGNINYIRNSVKILGDAYHGDGEAYIIDQDDPIIKAYKKTYPNVFMDGELPDAVKDYMKYPEFLFQVQSAMLNRYHLSTDEFEEFISNNDLWEVSKKLVRERNQTLATEIEPFYNTIKLPGGLSEKEEFILMRPFSPSGAERNNMVSWLTARNSYENYGEMVLFRFSKNTNILGPQQIGVQINQNEEISQLMTLLGQGDSSVYKGSLLVIPIEDSILYVEPIYIRAEGASSIPAIRRIITGYQKGEEFILGAGRTLEEALSKMFERSQLDKRKAEEDTGELTRKEDIQEEDIQEEDIQEEDIQEIIERNPPISQKDENLEKLLDDIVGRYDTIKGEVEDLGSLIEALRKLKVTGQ
jgi:uncharacterized membrane protein (UPF0182 family)